MADRTEREVAFEHEGVTVYHAYKNGGASGRLMDCWFSWSPSVEDNSFEFDFRKLSGVGPGMTASPGEAEETIRQAIDAGLAPAFAMPGFGAPRR